MDVMGARLLAEMEAQRFGEGEHGQALRGHVAALDQAPAHIVVPETASKVKIAAVQHYGGRIVHCSGDPADRQQVLDAVMGETGACLVHPFDDHRIIAGQATAALEMVGQAPNLDVVLAPVGGGGLISGMALAVHYTSPATRVIGVEPEGVDDAWRSFRAGRIVPVPGGHSIADGLLTTIGDKPFNIIQRHVNDIVTVADEDITDAMRFIWTRMKILVEPSAAVPLAALFSRRLELPGARIGVLLSGGNVDLDRLPW